MEGHVLNDEQITKYKKDGFLVIEKFLTDDEVQSLKQACWNIVEEMDPSKEIKTVFSTNNINHPFSNTKDYYFLHSADKVRFFFEEKAVDEKRQLTINKHDALNKIGHALHWHVPEFKTVTFSRKVKRLVLDLGYVSPAVVQSMYIFKPPGIGGEVTPHQDCTFLSTEPQSCIGLWFALEDTTLQNGCLWFSPGSHSNPTKRRFIRNPNNDGPLTIYTAQIDEDDQSLYIPVEVKKGTLVLISGQVNHKSEENKSLNSRHIYTFHVIEQKNVTWDPRNWIQPTEDFPFIKLLDVTA